MAEVASLDSWLLADCASTPATPSPISHSLKESPFANAASDGFRRFPTAPVPIPGLYRSRSSECTLLPELSSETLPDALAVIVERPDCTPSLAEPTAPPCTRKCAGAVPKSGFKACSRLTPGWRLEGTVRRGKKVRPAVLPALPWVPSWGRASDSDSILAAATAPEQGGPFSDQKAQWDVAASLPLQPMQAPVSLVSLCTALSTPASGRQPSLAAPQAGDCAQRRKGLQAPDAAEIAATVAAFSCSMLSGAAVVSSESPLPSPSPPSPPRQVAGEETPAAAVEALAGGACKATVVGATACPEASIGPAVSKGLALWPVSQVRSQYVGRPGSTSSKRGLYEGTVRGGSARNTWRFCNVAALGGPDAR